MTDAIMYCDIGKSIFALSVLAAPIWKTGDTDCRDAERTGAVAAGDGRAVLPIRAMVLADKRHPARFGGGYPRYVGRAQSGLWLNAAPEGPTSRLRI